MRLFNPRYNAEVGDLVVGRITEVRLFPLILGSRLLGSFSILIHRSNHADGKWMRILDKMQF